jgi:hypothetical protein
MGSSERGFPTMNTNTVMRNMAEVASLDPIIMTIPPHGDKISSPGRFPSFPGHLHGLDEFALKDLIVTAVIDFK